MDGVQLLLGILLGAGVLLWWQRKFGGQPMQSDTHLERQVVKAEERLRVREQELAAQIQRLSSAEKQFLHERERVRRAVEEEQEQMLLERDAAWARFEESVIGRLQQLLEDSHLGLPYFTNSTLPDSFSGKVKPDVVVDVGGQYVVFDAKVSKGDNLGTYIKDQVKKTAQKLSQCADIWNTVYFVVPGDQIGDVKETVLHEGAYTFVVITKEALYGVLYSLKQQMLMTVATSMDPQEREHIVGVLTLFLQHIDVHTAMHMIMAERGQAVRSELSRLPGGMQEEVSAKKRKLRIEQISAVAIKEQLLGT